MIFSDKSSLFDFQLLAFLHNMFKYYEGEVITCGECINECLGYLKETGVNQKI